MLETISEEDVDRLRRVFRVLFVVSLVAHFTLACYSSFRVWETWDSVWCVGFVLLACVLSTSCSYLVVFERACERENALETFQQPCLLRWFSYALTFPMQLVLCAWYARVRDLHTLMLLVAAQAVCALLGYVMEQAWTSQDLEEPVVERVDPMSLGVGTVVRGPQTDRFLLLTQQQKAGVAWTICLLCVALLHSVMWYVVVDTGSQFVLENKERFDAMVRAQCGLMSLLWLVPMLQVLTWWLGASSVEEGLVAGSVAYCALDTAAKIQLGVAFSVFVS